MTDRALELTTLRQQERPAPLPPDVEEEEDVSSSGLGRLEAVLTAVCTICLVTGWAGGLFGMPTPLQTVFYIGAYLSGGFFGTVNGLRALGQREINVDFLMVIAALGAAVIGHWGEGATLLFLFSLSNTLQAYALDRSRRAIRALMELRPSEALLRLADGTERQVPIEELAIGDVIIVKPGERIPMDGRVLAGSSAVDQAAITGESMPVDKSPGEEVFAGTVNGQGALEVEVSRLAADTTLAKIIQMVERAQIRKAPTQRFLDEFEPKYATGVVGATILTILLPYFVLHQPWEIVFYRAMTLLVVASPCALVISTPASILSAIANAARNGVLFKGGAYLEQAATLSAIAFDKTGTLTCGRPEVTDVVVAAEVLGDAWFNAAFFESLVPPGPSTPERSSRQELLRLAASVERYSEHPLGDAIVAAAEACELDLCEVNDLQAIPGQGVIGWVEGHEVRIGNPRFFERAHQIWPEPLRARARELEAEGKTVVGVSRDNHPLGFIALADVIRAEAPAALAALRSLGISRIVMITGDSQRVAEAVACQLEIDEFYSELLPGQKVEVVERLSHQCPVAMVGDGVNDAPAMAVSSLGVAMGAAGTDVALETADVVLMSDDLTKLAYLIGLSRRSRRVVWQNIAFSLAVIVTLIISVLAVGLPMPLGVVGHEGSTLTVVANGLRLLRTPRGFIVGPLG
ncbi:MAG: heavy metal translocating P-type ATPase [Ardenticatenaceae bacterium]|nr:heavy metal translocating P-type ATPase [Ardenticatenaceae bacterium]HBY97536.1 cadmium-translocating P-type ATPase [Chloroflexota bacterium]